MPRMTDSLPTMDTRAPLVPGADMARWIAAAVNGHSGARKLTDAEREAIGQEVALAVLRAGRTLPAGACPCGSPARWRVNVTDDYGSHVPVPRCDRHRGAAPARPIIGPVSARTVLDGRSAQERRAYLRRAVSSALESRTWQEHSGRWQSARDRQRDTGPMVVPAGADTDRSDTGAGTGMLALALDVASAKLDTAPNVGADTGILRADPRAVAGTLGQASDWSPAQTRDVAAALARAAAAAAGEDTLAALDALATDRGTTLRAIQQSASRGAKLLRAIGSPEIAAGILLRAMRDTAAHARDWRGHWALAVPDTAPNVARTVGPWETARRRTVAPVDRQELVVTRAEAVPVNPRAALRAEVIARAARLPGYRPPGASAKNGAKARTVKRAPNPCRCERGERCPIHRPRPVAPHRPTAWAPARGARSMTARDWRMAQDGALALARIVRSDTAPALARMPAGSYEPTHGLEPAPSAPMPTVKPFTVRQTTGMLTSRPVVRAWRALRQRQPMPTLPAPTPPPCSCESCQERRRLQAGIVIGAG